MAVIHVNDSNFQDEVLGSNIPVLVDFWAEWCAPCKALAPTMDALAEKYDGKVKVVKINTDDAAATAQQFGIMSIPSVFVFKNGVVSGQLSGKREQEDYEEILDSVI